MAGCFFDGLRAIVRLEITSNCGGKEEIRRMTPLSKIVTALAVASLGAAQCLAQGQVAALTAVNEELLPSGYTRVSLHPLRGGVSATASGINDQDAVVGNSQPGGAAVMWKRSRRRPRILDESQTGGNAEAKAINNCGSIAGYTQLASTNQAWLLSRTSGLTSIGPSDESTVAWGVNCNDEVVGWWERPEFAEAMRAFRWSRQEGLLDLGLYRGWAKSINNAGHVVGVYLEGDSWEAFMWDSINGALNLGPIIGCTTSGGLCSDAWDINVYGQVVGAYRTGLGAEDHPYLWSSMDGKIDLPVHDARALAINDNGVVAGIRGGIGVAPTIWVWSPTDGARDIDTITETNSYSLWLRMNDFGDIVGTRNLIDGTTVATLWRHP